MYPVPMPSSQTYLIYPKELNEKDLHGRTLDVKASGVGRIKCVRKGDLIQVEAHFPPDGPACFVAHLTEVDVWSIIPHPLAGTGPDFLLDLG